MLKKTKIICTQGPATERPGVVDALIANGMNCARFNFSHGDHAEHLNRINMVREAAKKAGKVISLILDTKGPEMRLGEFKDGKVMLEKGNQFTLTYEDIPGDETHVSVNHKGLYTEVKPGDTLLLSDGLVALKVDEIRGKDIITTIQNSGKMSTKKRVAAPGVSRSRMRRTSSSAASRTSISSLLPLSSVRRTSWPSASSSRSTMATWRSCRRSRTSKASRTSMRFSKSPTASWSLAVTSALRFRPRTFR